MDAELAALASSGATTLIGLMVTDGWQQVRRRFAALFGDQSTSMDEELERSRTTLVAARQAMDQATADDLEAEWRSRLRRLLTDDPGTAHRLRAVLDELAGPAGGVHTETHFRGTTINGPVNTGSGAQITYGLTYGTRSDPSVHE
ncbi:hypothetical protein [Streptomyces mexicanus]|jgi:hypothetical protein|uniref:hypothetical protein n=1 Tax=Streptomyces mexicanus TaxID=178566 RepID=UPI00366916C5